MRGTFSYEQVLRDELITFNPETRKLEDFQGNQEIEL